MLVFRRNRPTGSTMGSTIARRLLVLGVLAILALVLVMRRRDDTDRPSIRPPVLPQAQVGSLALAVSEPSPAEVHKSLFPGVRSDYLDSVRDDTVFRASESDAWFHLLELLDRTSQAKLEAASLGPVGYLQLDDQAPSYRGRLVTVSGTVRKVKLVEAPENGYDIKRYYQLWLQPLRSEPELIVVYALKLPEGFPQGDELDAEVHTTGFFFKRWAYKSQDGIRSVPLVLARTVDWRPPPPATARPPAGEQYVFVVGAAIALAVVVIAFVAARNRRAARPRDSNPVALAIRLPDDESGDASSDRNHSVS